MVKRRRVLVTDVHSPVGRAVATRLADRGHWVLACGCRAKDERDLPRETAAGGIIEVYVADLASEASCVEALSRIESCFGGLDAIVITHSEAHPGPLEHLAPAEARQAFESSLFMPLLLIQRALRLLEEGTNSRIIWVAQTEGPHLLPLRGMIRASQYAAKAACQSLAQELGLFGVKVVLVEPPLVRERIVARQSAQGESYGRYTLVQEALIKSWETLTQRATTPDIVARVIQRALTAKRPKDRYAVPAGRRLTGRGGQAATRRRIEKLLGQVRKKIRRNTKR